MGEDIDCAGLDDIMKKRVAEPQKPAEINPNENKESLKSEPKVEEKTEIKLSDLFEAFFPNIPLGMENVQDGVWTPAEVAQICINHQDDVDLAIEKIYERKFIPNDNKNEGQDEKIEEAMSDYGSDIVESRILDSNNQ